MKKIGSLLVLCLLILALALPATASAKTLKIALGDPIDSDQGVMALRFKDVLEKSSNGKYKVEIFPAGQLGSEQATVQSARRGNISGAVVAINNITPFAKSVGILTLPYLITNFDDAVKLTTGDLGAYWREAGIKEGGVRIIGWCYSDFRVLTNSKRPVTKMEDLKGLKIRVPKNAIMIATWKALGANPVPLAWPETFTALQQGVVDGQTNPYITDYTMKFHEVQKYVSESHQVFSLQPLVVGEKFYQKLSPEDKMLITRAGIEAQQYNLYHVLTGSAAAKKKMVDFGMQAFNIEDEDMWIKTAKEKVWPQFYEEVGGKAKVDEILKALGR